ncbi:unnamed protein product [Cylicocyclus nassatus]|uniref:Carbohydrate sulfotransferase n=1 Tax=Cylicocyclus nassatus TaxID=53992 RepID=A0AA36DTE7_CYLNA|nr:unnamed protein product [Cylicocyclus nassatus]
MSTIRDGIFCYLHNPVEFVANNRRISTENFVNRFCSSGTDREKCSSITEQSPKRIKFAVVRDPIDRFLSGYADKCYPKRLPLPPERCFGCEQNINCFVETLLSKLRSIIRDPHATNYMETSHFAPQTWSCNFKEHLYDYTIIKYESGPQGIRDIATQFDNIFSLAGVPDYYRSEIQKEMLIGKTIHTTSGTDLRRHVENLLYSNRTLLRMITQLYYFDFIVFGFKFPNFTEISANFNTS